MDKEQQAYKELADGMQNDLITDVEQCAKEEGLDGAGQPFLGAERFTPEAIDEMTATLKQLTDNKEDIVWGPALPDKSDTYDTTAVRNVAPIHSKAKNVPVIGGRDIKGRVTPETKDTASVPGKRSGVFKPQENKRTNQVSRTTMVVGPKPRTT